MARPSCPNECDILCGKDKTYAKHPGNRLFREHIEATRFAYKSAKTKQEKMKITTDIVAYFKVKMHARFLKPTGNGQWVEIRDTKARDKVSHALRFSARNDDDNSSANDSSSHKSSGPTTKNNKSNRRGRTNSYNGSLSSSGGMSVSSSASNNGHENSSSDIGLYNTTQMSVNNDIACLHYNSTNATITLEREEGQYHERIYTAWGLDMVPRMVALDSAVPPSASSWMEAANMTVYSHNSSIQSNEPRISDAYKEMTALQSEDLDAILQEPLILDEWESSMERD